MEKRSGRDEAGKFGSQEDGPGSTVGEPRRLSLDATVPSAGRVVKTKNPRGGGIKATTRQPISERRLAANRANAQKSTGPRTPEGKRRVARNACRHNLYSKLHHLPDEIADLLYRKALEETADIADPRYRALFVHRLMLRGHERRLLQLEGKLWAEALRVNNGIIPYASLWIRENHAEVIQALGRYHAWICVRIRAIQKSIFPYIIGDVENQTGIPTRTQTLLASAAGSSRPIMLATTAGTHLSSDNQFTSTGPWNPSPSGQPDETVSAQPTISTNRNLPPAGGISSLFTARRGFRPVRPIPAPQAVKAIRPPTVPGLSLRFLNRSRKPNPSTKPESPTTNHDRQGVVSALRTAHVSKRAPIAVAASTEQAEVTNSSTPDQAVPAECAKAFESTTTPIPEPRRRANPAQSSPREATNPTRPSSRPSGSNTQNPLSPSDQTQQITHAARRRTGPATQPRRTSNYTRTSPLPMPKHHPRPHTPFAASPSTSVRRTPRSAQDPQTLLMAKHHPRQHTPFAATPPAPVRRTPRSAQGPQTLPKAKHHPQPHTPFAATPPAPVRRTPRSAQDPQTLPTTKQPNNQQPHAAQL
ncbi:MAG: hypothetical protein QM757_35840 [Paludibaculum sp.]